MRRILTLLLILLPFTQAPGREYHVTTSGSDAADGSLQSPFRTISRAAQLALPGDTVTVHGGTYREWVDPLYGGTDDANRILYRAAEGEVVELKGSEPVTDWKKGKDGVWTAVLPNSFFGAYNPFADRIHGDWFVDLGRVHHTAEVYLDDVSLYEVERREIVARTDTLIKSRRDPEGSCLMWYAEVGATETTLYPSRTRKLSSLLPTILGWRRPGKIGSANTKPEVNRLRVFAFYQIFTMGEMMIELVNSANIRQAAEVHAISWRESHRDICSEEFIAVHTTERQIEYLKSQMKKGAAIYLLSDAGKPVGIVSIRDDVVGDLYVLPDQQGRGYGTQLLRFAIEKCVGTPTLWVLNQNQRAIRLYERNGFRLTGERKELSETLSELQMRLMK